MDQNFNSIHILKNYSTLVIWSLGNFCPYSCSYCPDYFHNGKFKYHDTDVVLKTFAALPDKTRIIFSGGEPTYHPDIENILDQKKDTHTIGFITNAARNIGFWERILPKVDTLIFTFHLEFANISRFIETSTLCKKKLDAINLTMIPSRWNECVEAYEKLMAEGLPVSPKPLMEDFGWRSTSIISGYSAEQTKWISNKNLSGSKNFIIIKDKENNVIQTTNPSQLLASGNANFNGWQCNTPTERLYILFTGEVFDTSCRQKKPIGNIYDTFAQTTTPIICEQKICWSHSDISSAKIKII